MTCFSVPASTAILTTLFRKRFPESWHINWLNTMIWGGSLALAIEHVAHGEIVPWPPFLTAMANPADFAAMLGELVTVGLPMLITIILVWGVLAITYEKVLAPSKVLSKAGA